MALRVEITALEQATRISKLESNTARGARGMLRMKPDDGSSALSLNCIAAGECLIFGILIRPRRVDVAQRI